MYKKLLYSEYVDLVRAKKKICEIISLFEAIEEDRIKVVGEGETDFDNLEYDAIAIVAAIYSIVDPKLESAIQKRRDE